MDEIITALIDLGILCVLKNQRSPPANSGFRSSTALKPDRQAMMDLNRIAWQIFSDYRGVIDETLMDKKSCP